MYIHVCVQETQTGGVYVSACQWRSRNSRWWIIFPRVVEFQLENVNKTTSSCPVAFLCFLEAMRHSFNPPQCCSHSKNNSHPSSITRFQVMKTLANCNEWTRQVSQKLTSNTPRPHPKGQWHLLIRFGCRFVFLLIWCLVGEMGEKWPKLLTFW